MAVAACRGKMSLLQYVGLIAFAFMLALGQILFKRTADASEHVNDMGSVFQLFAAPSFWLAVVLYGGATLLWIRMLQSVPLSRAYPFAALGFVIVPVASFFFFDESISWRYAIGAALIVAGVIVTAQS